MIYVHYIARTDELEAVAIFPGLLLDFRKTPASRAGFPGF